MAMKGRQREEKSQREQNEVNSYTQRGFVSPADLKD